MNELWMSLVRASSVAAEGVRAELDHVLQLMAVDPVFAASIAVIVAAALSPIGYLIHRRRRRSQARPARALALAAKGLEPAEIARQTRLSHDAVAMLLIRFSAQNGRRDLPRAARIADATAVTNAGKSAEAAPETVASKPLTRKTENRHGRAHRLLDVLASTVRIPRYGRAA